MLRGIAGLQPIGSFFCGKNRNDPQMMNAKDRGKVAVILSPRRRSESRTANAGEAFPMGMILWAGARFMQ
jgi:hypothetical protein